jgi:hypothetical protein
LRLACLAFAIALAPVTASAAPMGPYLFEQLRKPEYKATFDALFKGQSNIEPWLKEYLRNRNGVDAPMETRIAGGKSYEFYSVCQPHNCPDNFIYVFFTPGGAHAWVLFTKDDGTSRFFGSPDAKMQAALRAAAQPQ